MQATLNGIAGIMTVSMGDFLIATSITLLTSTPKRSNANKAAAIQPVGHAIRANAPVPKSSIGYPQYVSPNAQMLPTNPIMLRRSVVIFLPNSIIQPPCVRTVLTHRGFVRTKAARRGRLRPRKACEERGLSARGFPFKEKEVLSNRNRKACKG